MRTDEGSNLRTALPDLGSEFAQLLADAGKIESSSTSALDCSLERVRRGQHESAFASAAPDRPGRESG